MKQEPRAGRVIPVPMQYRSFGGQGEMVKPEAARGTWDYIYEPDARTLLDGLMRRYIEAIVYQALAENMGSEQSARMVAMKAATDNAGNLINELKLIYNKTRQAAITKELSEIVSGAAAV
jgi:F-type H+-transporting ATPase subunit gamma